MTPSRPAPSKRRNQSAATLDSLVAGVRWIGGAADESSDSSLRRRLLNAVSRRSRSPSAEQIEEHDRCRDFLGKKLHPRRSGMNTKLQRIEVEPTILCDDDFAIKHAAIGQLRPERLEQFGEVAVQRFFVAALDQDLVSVAKHQRTKSIPFRFEDPCSACRQFANALGEHRQNWRVHRKVHTSILYCTPHRHPEDVTEPRQVIRKIFQRKPNLRIPESSNLIGIREDCASLE